MIQNDLIYHPCRWNRK